MNQKRFINDSEFQRFDVCTILFSSPLWKVYSARIFGSFPPFHSTTGEHVVSDLLPYQDV
jgi:hypothetical protein